MALQLGEKAPDFEAETTQGHIRFHDWMGDSWCVLFSHPKDFTPVCTTELGYMAKLKPEFDKRNTKIIGLSVDPVDQSRQMGEGHRGDARPGAELSDDRRHRSHDLEALRHVASRTRGNRRRPHAPPTIRPCAMSSSSAPDKSIKLIIVYPMTTGRNFDEVLRVIDSLQMTAKHKVATPVNWKPGEDVIIAGSVCDEEAKKIYPQGLEGAEAVAQDRAATKMR